MNISKNYFIVAQNAVLDKENKLTLVNIFNVFKAKSLPIIPTQLFLVVNLNLESVSKRDKQIEISYSIKAPSGKKIWSLSSQKMSIDVTSKNQSIGNIIGISGISFPEYGEYQINLLIDNKKTASTSIKVLKE